MMNRREELNVEMMEQVNGGDTTPIITWRIETVHIHNKCGGKINTNVFWYNECQGCGEENFWLSDFDYHDEEYVIKY